MGDAAALSREWLAELVERRLVSKSAIGRLAANGLSPHAVLFQATPSGHPQLLSGLFVRFPGAGPCDDPLAGALAFMRRHAILFGWSDDVHGSMHLKSAAPLLFGGTAIRLGQSIHGLPIDGASLLLHVHGDGTVSHFAGNYPSTTAPRLSKACLDAIKNTKPVIAKAAAALGTCRVLTPPRLAWYSTGWNCRKNALLLSSQALVLATETGQVLRIIVDISSGTILFVEPATQGSFASTIWDARNGLPFELPPEINPNPVIEVREGGAWYGYVDPAAPEDAHDAIGHIRTVYRHWEAINDRLKRVFDGLHQHWPPWESYDGRGSPLNAVVRFGSSTLLEGYTGLWLGDGDAKDTGYAGSDYPTFPAIALPEGNATLDWIAHELGHAFLAHSCALDYSFQSGALNEHLSDVLAALVSRSWVLFGTSRWGVETRGSAGRPSRPGAVRSLRNPPESWSGHWPDISQPDNYDMYATSTRNIDFGVVHTNVGILNKAAWLFGREPRPRDPALTVEFNGVPVRTHLRDGLSIAAYVMQRFYLTSASDFSSWRQALVNGALWYDALRTIESGTDVFYDSAAENAEAAADAVGVWRFDGWLDPFPFGAAWELNVGGRVDSTIFEYYVDTPEDRAFKRRLIVADRRSLVPGAWGVRFYSYDPSRSERAEVLPFSIPMKAVGPLGIVGGVDPGGGGPTLQVVLRADNDIAYQRFVWPIGGVPASQGPWYVDLGPAPPPAGPDSGVGLTLVPEDLRPTAFVGGDMQPLGVYWGGKGVVAFSAQTSAEKPPVATSWAYSIGGTFTRMTPAICTDIFGRAWVVYTDADTGRIMIVSAAPGPSFRVLNDSGAWSSPIDVWAVARTQTFNPRAAYTSVVAPTVSSVRTWDRDLGTCSRIYVVTAHASELLERTGKSAGATSEERAAHVFSFLVGADGEIRRLTRDVPLGTGSVSAVGGVMDDTNRVHLLTREAVLGYGNIVYSRSRRRG